VENQDISHRNALTGSEREFPGSLGLTRERKEGNHVDVDKKDSSRTMRVVCS